ncbi:MAG: hypothetical protein AAGA46_08260 [Cyanobacteria bacterium P01_F01_bin.13]
MAPYIYCNQATYRVQSSRNETVTAAPNPLNYFATTNLSKPTSDSYRADVTLVADVIQTGSPIPLLTLWEANIHDSQLVTTQIRAFDTLISSVHQASLAKQDSDHHQGSLSQDNQSMEQQLEHRLKELKTELASGQKMLAKLEQQETDFRTTLLRISGAIQVIEEELKNYQLV